MPNLKIPLFACFNGLLLFGANFLFLKDIYLNQDIRSSIAVSIFLFSSYLCLAAIFSLSKLASLVFNIIFFLTASFLNYFKYQYGVIISTTLIQSVLHTDSGEAGELINLSLISAILFTGILPCLLIFFALKVRRVSLKSLSYITIIISVLLPASYVILPSKANNYKPVYLKDSLTYFMPYNYILALKNYYKLYQTHKQPKQDISKFFNFTLPENSPADLKVILVIGESARADRFGINGYIRNTTPHLKERSNILSFKKAYSLATNTPTGVQAITTMHGHYSATSIISVFNKLGYNSYWFSNQGTKYEVINSIAREAKKVLFSDDLRISSTDSNNYDKELLPHLERALVKQEQSFIVLHTIGSHRLYDLRYPAEFKQFKPSCINNEIYYSVNECKDLDKLNNSYDNSILYTDYFLDEVITRLESYNAIMIYISDHGESLGENGVFAHAAPLATAPKEQTHIPLILWASDKFLANGNNRINLSNAKKLQNTKIDQSFIFHSILGCLGINSSGLEINKNICAAK